MPSAFLLNVFEYIFLFSFVAYSLSRENKQYPQWLFFFCSQNAMQNVHIDGCWLFLPEFQFIKSAFLKVDNT